MDTNSFSTNLNRFDVLDLVAQYEFKTESSISFTLGHGTPAHFQSLGRVEVHHPCVGSFNARLRVWLPDQHINLTSMIEVIQRVFLALTIPDNETHEAIFFETGYRAFYMANFEVKAGLKEFVFAPKQLV